MCVHCFKSKIKWKVQNETEFKRNIQKLLKYNSANDSGEKNPITINLEMAKLERKRKKNRKSKWTENGNRT